MLSLLAAVFLSDVPTTLLHRYSTYSYDGEFNGMFSRLAGSWIEGTKDIVGSVVFYLDAVVEITTLYKFCLWELYGSNN